MKVCVVGAGAIGGFLGVKLACSDQNLEVTLIARGAHLDAIRSNGLRLIMQDGTEETARGAAATADLHAPGPQDMVILALKAHQIEPAAADLPALFGPDTILVSIQNGIPWWYFHKHGGELEGRAVKSVDPRGVIAANIAPERILGCIAYPAAEIAAPGVVRHIEGVRFPVGEPDGHVSERAAKVAEMFINAGLKSPVLTDFRSELWLKLWGNLSFNPVSALTHSTLEDICRFAPSRRLVEQMMTEAQTIAYRLGVSLRAPLEKRIAGAERVGRHKTSMLQDVESGRAVEIDALVGAVVELGELTGAPTPYIDAVYSCVKLLDKTMAEENIRIAAQPLRPQARSARAGAG